MINCETASPKSSRCAPPKWNRLTQAAALLCAFTASLPAQTNLLQNGSFETPAISASFVQTVAIGWTGQVAGTSTPQNPDILRKAAPTDWSGATGYSGDQWVELDASANIALFQDVATTAGQTYRLTFKYANRPGVASSSIIVRWNGTQVGSVFTTTSPVFVTATIPNLTATGATSRVSLEAAGTPDQQGDWIDDVQLVSEAAIVAPTLTSLTTSPASPIAGESFTFTAQGTNFDPNTIQVQITGPGCTPCFIGNGQLGSKSTTTIAGGTLLGTAGAYTFAVQNGNSGALSSGQALTVGAPGPVNPTSLTFTYLSGGTLPTAQTLQLRGPNTTPTSYSIDFPTVNWLTVTPTAGLTPANATVTVTPQSLAPNTYQTQLTVRFAGGTNVNIPVTLQVQVPTGGTGGNPNQVLSHIADSQGWQTSITLVNHDFEPAPFSLRFYGSQTTGRAAGVPLEMGFVGLAGRSSLVEGVIPAGGSRTITTAGADAVLNMGWVELVTTKNIKGSSVFRSVTQRQEAAVSLTSGVRAFLLPFDNSNGRVTSYALVNTNAASPVTVNATVRDENGAVLGTTTIALLPRGHVATETTGQFPVSANQRGVIEFVTQNPDITGLGIRFDAPPSQAFTSFPVQPRQ